MQEENSVNMQIIKFILAARTCLQHKQYKIAYKILDKAEMLATEHQLFPLLNEIFHTKIQYAYANDSIDLDNLISKFQSNQKNYQLEDQLNIVYAKIRQTLNNINYKGEIVDFQTILNNTLKEHDISIDESLSFKSLYQLVAIISLSAFVTKDYLKIEPFLINTYNTLLKHKNKYKQLYYHIEILYLIANTLFRNKKFDASLQYLKLMHQYMQNSQKKHYNTFKLKYNLLFSLNLNYSNKQSEAIENAMQDYGKYLGTAFQLVDDIMDYASDSEEMGKNMGDDLAEGKPTLPLLYAMWHGNEQQTAIIREAIETGNGMENLAPILETMEQTGALTYTKQQALKASQQAIDALSPIEESVYKEALIGLAHISVERVA